MPSGTLVVERCILPGALVGMCSVNVGLLFGQVGWIENATTVRRAKGRQLPDIPAAEYTVGRCQTRRMGSLGN